MKKPSKESILHFIDRQGFVIVLVLCLCVIGATAIVRGGTQSQPDMTPPPAQLGLLTSELPDAQQVGSVPQSVDRLSEVAKATPTRMPASTPKPTLKPTPTPIPIVFSWPVNGKIQRAYAMETLIYLPTLDQWSTHGGLDIACAMGDAVVAVRDGKVLKAFEDDLLGNVIVLQHEDNLCTLYAGLATIEMVRIDDRISKGQTLSMVGRLPFESLDDPHLHFEVFKDEQNVDPLLYLEKK